MKAYRGYGNAIQSERFCLDCPDCGGWFENFTTLADHVQGNHVLKQRKTAAQIADEQELAANRQHINERLAEEKETDMNIPSTGRGAAKSNKKELGRIPSASTEQANDYNAFLKWTDIGKKIGSRALLTLTGEARMQSGTFGEQIVAEVRLGRTLFDWSFKLNSMNHREIEQRFGLNPAKWRNKKFTVEVKEHMGREYIAVVLEKAAKSAPARKTKRKAKR